MTRPFAAIILLFVVTLLSSVLAIPSHKVKRNQDSSDKSLNGTECAPSDKRGSILSLLNPIKAVDERKKLFIGNHLSAKAKNESRTAREPLSLSGQKVTLIKGGMKSVNQTVLNSVKLGVEHTSSLSGSDASKIEAVKTEADTCKKTDNRKPWSEATKEERQAWLKAIRCTYDQPGTFSQNGIKSESLAHDFGYIHGILNIYLHGNPAFLVCHRALLFTWLDKLQNECGYTGDSLYLDLNTYSNQGKLLSSRDLWSPDLLGSLACPAQGQYVDGLHFDYIGTKNQSSVSLFEYKHPLCRSSNVVWDDGSTFEQHLRSDVVTELLQLDGYDNFRLQTETKLHNAFHACIRRDMYSSTSPFDAFLFFSYHLWVDCLYWVWQEKDEGKNRLKYNGLHRGTNKSVTINDMCPMLTLGTNWTVADVIDSREPPGCFNCNKFKPFA